MKILAEYLEKAINFEQLAEGESNPNLKADADAARITRPGLKVSFITGFAENAAISYGHLDSGMHLIAKPFVMAAFANKVVEIIEV